MDLLNTLCSRSATWKQIDKCSLNGEYFDFIIIETSTAGCVRSTSVCVFLHFYLFSNVIHDYMIFWSLYHCMHCNIVLDYFAFDSSGTSCEHLFKLFIQNSWHTDAKQILKLSNAFSVQTSIFWLHCLSRDDVSRYCYFSNTR